MTMLTRVQLNIQNDYVTGQQTDLLKANIETVFT